MDVPNVSHLPERLATLEGAVVSLAESQRATQLSLQGLASDLRDAQKPQYGVMAAWSAVLVSVVAALGGLVSWGLHSELASLERGVTEAHALALVQAELNGETRARIRSLEKSVINPVPAQAWAVLSEQLSRQLDNQ
jgi:hypothetical protein